MIRLFWANLILLFIALQLTGHISWSWFWVLWPITVPLLLVLSPLLLAGGVVFAIALVEALQEHRRERRDREPKP